MVYGDENDYHGAQYDEGCCHSDLVRVLDRDRALVHDHVLVLDHDPILVHDRARGLYLLNLGFVVDIVF